MSTIKSKKSTNKAEKDPNNALRWTIGTLVALLPIAALYFTAVAGNTDAFVEGSNKFVLENIGTTFLVAYAAATLLLAGWTKTIFWPFVSKKDRAKMDEHMLHSRMAVFERSYKLLAVVALLLALYGNNNGKDQRLLLAKMWVFGISYFALPTIVAFRRKDSF